MKPILRQTLLCLGILISVVGFLCASEQQFQDEIATEEFYYDR